MKAFDQSLYYKLEYKKWKNHLKLESIQKTKVENLSQY